MEYSKSVLISFQHQKNLLQYLFSRSPERDGVPKRFLCAFTGILLEDPVTMPDGWTYERNILQKWYEKGNHHSPYKPEIKLVEPKTVATNIDLLVEINKFKHP